MSSLLFMLSMIIDVFWWFVIISIVLSWLVAFNVINLHNQFVYNIYNSLNSIVDPMLQPFRRFLPDMGGIDLSPIFLLIILSTLSFFVRYELPQYMGL
jgi:YggT family protein